jgi:hypothetical protein
MPLTLALILHWLAGGIGVLLVYSALFLYENEEGRLQNILESWWLQISQIRSKIVSKETAFVKTVTAITSNCFDRVFGTHLLGPRALSTSVCYSLASGILTMTLLFVGWITVRRTCILVFSSAFFLILGTIKPFAASRAGHWLWLATIAFLGLIWYPVFDFFEEPSFFEGLGSEISIALPFAIISDLLFIAMTRVLLRYATRCDSFTKITSLTIGNVILAAGLTIAPVLINGKIGLLIAASNILDVLVASVFIVISASMLIHRITWPILERPVYAFHRYNIFSQHKKIVFFSGVSLISIAFPTVGHKLAEMAAAVHP